MIIKNDTVVVITGKEKGKMGKVLKVINERSRVLVEKLNLVKKHNKPSQTNPKGSISEKEAPMNISNVELFCSKCNKGVRVSYKIVEGSKSRYCKKCNSKL